MFSVFFFFFFQAEDGIRDVAVTGVQTCALPISRMTMTTAEWICTRCGSTNRVLVPDGATHATDECVTCHTRHALEADARPVRWRARAPRKKAPGPPPRGRVPRPQPPPPSAAPPP